MVKKELKLIVLSVLCIVTAQLLLKYGLKSVTTTNIGIELFKETLLNPYVLIGIVLFTASALLWMLVLSKVELSYAYPALSLSYVFTVIGAWLLFNENLNALRIAGIIVICAGVYALSKS